MTDPPPKKIGSLRDRIAAFENKAAKPTTAPPPPSRPKPGHFAQWAPKPASPPGSPSSRDNVAGDGGEHKAAMSASDAKESIGKLSLKERMAALQSSTAFGAAAPPPRPSGEKPKWKPPPEVQRAEPIGGEDEEEMPKHVDPAPSEQEGEVGSSMPIEEQKEGEAEAETKEAGEPHPEEEERQRRAALAARMARLGGARIGMGPPIAGKKPEIPPKRIEKKSTLEEEDKPKVEDQPAEVKPELVVLPEEKLSGTPPSPIEIANASPTVQKAIATELPPSTEASMDLGSPALDYFATSATQDSSAMLSPESTASPPVRSPAMPVPLAPKRAAPPRKRAAKSPSPAARLAVENLHEDPSPIQAKGEIVDVDHVKASPAELPAADREHEVTENQVEHIVESAAEHIPEEVTEIAVAAPELDHDLHVSPLSEPVAIEDPSQDRASEPTVDVTSGSHGPALVLEQGPHIEEVVAEERAGPESEGPAVELEATALTHDEEEGPEEEDEAARRKRIAERIAKSGGFNPFAGGMPSPALRKDSADSVRSAPSPALPMRRYSQQESEASESPSSARPFKSEHPERKESVDLSSDGGITEEPQASEQSKLDHDLYDNPMIFEDKDEETRGRSVARTVLYERNHHEDVHDEWYGRETDEVSETIKAESDPPGAWHPPPPPLASRPPVPHGTREIQEDAAISQMNFPPPPPIASRPLPTVPHAETTGTEEGADDAIAPPPLPRRIFSPPPQRTIVPPPPPLLEEEDGEDHAAHHADEEEEAYAKHAREVGPEQAEGDDHDEQYDGAEEEEKRVYIGEHRGHSEEEFADHEDPDAQERVPPPPPRRFTLPRVSPPPVPIDGEDEEPVPPPPPRRVSLKLPPLPPHASAVPHIDESNEEVYEREEVRETVEVEEPDQGFEMEELAPSPPPPRHTRPISQTPVIPPRRASSKPILPLHGPALEQEVLDDSDVDPIDPEFYRTQKSMLPTPSPRRISFPPLASLPQPPSIAPPLPPPSPPPLQSLISLSPQRVISPPSPPERAPFPPSVPSPSPPPPASKRPAVTSPVSEQWESNDDDDGADAEQARRRTIAERMAKLGGLRFGAPLPVAAVLRPAPPPEPESEREEGQLQEPSNAGEAAPEEEEDEFARKQRIAARIAGMGGMRLGMLPVAALPKAPQRVQREEEEDQKPLQPPKRSAPIPHPPSSSEDDHEEPNYQHVSDSDHAQQEESELEEVTYTDVEVEDEAPPVPDRHGRRISGPPPVPQTHSFASPPPVPRTRPPAPPAFTYPPPPPHAPPPPATRETQGGEFILVDQPENVDGPPPPPPPRAARPPRALPRAPPTASEDPKSGPSLPSIDFGGETDLSLSGQWSEDSTNYPALPSSVVSDTQPSAHIPATSQTLTPDDLMSQWGRVGVQVHETAAAFFEKSKQSVVGDGSYIGFVNAVLGQVPNAAQPTESLDSFGYLIYSQAAGAVQRRVSDIMPGDVIVVQDAKFKGHKGLQSYSQNIGVGAPLVGVIGDFEAKKSKVKVYQANQHVGQQSVESVSYRLEDMKSGLVKIFRILEA